MPDMGTTSLKSFFWGDTNLPKQYALFLLPIVILQSAKTLLLKTLYSSDTGLGGNELELIWKLPS